MSAIPNMQGKTVVTQLEGSVLKLILNRPKSLNSLNLQMVEELVPALTAIKNDSHIRVVVVQGAGDHFMAGGDIAMFARSFEMDEDERKVFITETMAQVKNAIHLLRALPQPVIASIRGACAGFGLSLVCACDLAIAASESSRFTMAYSGLGITPDGGATWTIPRISGQKIAAQLLLTGMHFDAKKAVSMQLVNDAVADEELDSTCAKLAQQLAQGPRNVLAKTKALIWAAREQDFGTHLNIEGDTFIETFLQPEFKEGVDAFLNKRKPNFTGLS